MLNSQLWQEVSPYLDRVLAMPEEEREAWLVSLCEENSALANLLKSLLDEHDVLSRERFLEHRDVWLDLEIPDVRIVL